MQLSIGKLAAAMIALLVTVTVVTTAAGLYVVHGNFRSLEERRAAEANDTLLSAANSIRNQIRFYQSLLHLIAGNAEVVDLIEFGEGPQIQQWSRTVGRLLPGALGTALTSPDGIVFGDPLTLRVGPGCQVDLKNSISGNRIDYPLLHTDVPGLEHFDLLAKVDTPNSKQAGTLFVSFRLSVLEEMLEGIAHHDDRFVLRDKNGEQHLTVGAGPAANVRPLSYRKPVPDTSWELELLRPAPPGNAFLVELIIADAIILLVVSAITFVVVRGTHRRFASDLRRIHEALEGVLAGNYQPSQQKTAIKETAILLPDIEQLAIKIQRQRNELRHQSLSDPLTGAFNRRYFDLMLGHMHEQSRRQQPATLVVLDLNDFKHINDEFGHAIGDRVLQRAAGYLKSRVRASDIVVRLGGDEFALILNLMADGRLEEWLTALVHDYDHLALESCDGAVCFCQFSIGAASIDAGIYATPGDVFDAADEAMYGVKQRRRIRHSRFAIARVATVATATSATA